MYDLEPLIILVNTDTEIQSLVSSGVLNVITIAQEKTPVLTEGPGNVTIGYYDMNSQSPSEPKADSIINQAAENLVQGFDVQTDCDQKDLPIIWRALHKALIGKNTQPLEEEFSGLTYGTGGVIGLSQGRMNWLDRWRVDFPTINLF